MRWVIFSEGMGHHIAKALSRVFRGKFINYLKKAFAEGKPIFPGHLAHLAIEEHFLGSIHRLWEKDWIVYSKAPFNGPQKVLDYLGRYTHRVTIANHRIVEVKKGGSSIFSVTV